MAGPADDSNTNGADAEASAVTKGRLCVLPFAWPRAPPAHPRTVFRALRSSQGPAVRGGGTPDLWRLPLSCAVDGASRRDLFPAAGMSEEIETRCYGGLK